MAKIEVFIAGCPLCDDAVKTVRETACPKCEVLVHNLNDGTGFDAARRYGITRVPAVTVDGEIAQCCAQGKVDADQLRSMGVGAGSGG